MKISAKGRYAVRVMVDIANFGTEYVSISEIAQRQNISNKYLEKVIACLLKAKLLISMRGQNGGYKLSKLPKEYSIAEILNVTKDTPNLATCFENDCPMKDKCSTVGCWSALTDIINDYLTKVTLQDLLDKTYNK